MIEKDYVCTRLVFWKENPAFKIFLYWLQASSCGVLPLIGLFCPTNNPKQQNAGYYHESLTKQINIHI